MNDLSLSQALDSSPDLDWTGFEPCCSNTTDVQDFFRLDEGLDLMVTHNLKTLKSVANLLLAADRMTKLLSSRGQELQGDELCSAIMESLVTETIIKASSSAGVKRVFQRLNSGYQWTMCDSSKKDIVRNSRELKLQAVTLKGGHGERKVNFKLSQYASPIVSPGETQTVLLSITNQLHMSCSMKDGRAVLNLEQCSELELDSISDDENMDRFLFFKADTEVYLKTFESVKCRGWFISTSYDEENKEVEMCRVDAVYRLNKFILK